MVDSPRSSRGQERSESRTGVPRCANEKRPEPHVPASRNAPPGRHAGRQPLRSEKIGALPLLNHFLQRLCLEELLAQHLPPEDSRVKAPASKALLVLLRNLLIACEPLYGIGNTTDDHTHIDTWELLCELAGRRDFLYVVDSKLATAGNMAYLHQYGGRFITVLPQTRREDKDSRTLPPPHGSLRD